MKSTLLYRSLACLLLCSTALAELPPHHPPLSPRKAAAMARVANTETEYEELAAFYHQQERDYAAAGAQQKQAYDYATRHWGSKAYPQAADRARLLEEFYEQRSLQSRQLADLYAQKASGLRSRAALDAKRP